MPDDDDGLPVSPEDEDWENADALWEGFPFDAGEIHSTQGRSTTESVTRGLQ
jgi:hypothetical protein